MSIPVALPDLAAEAATRPFAYLMTTRADGRPQGIAVTPSFEGSVMVTEAGRSTCSNATERPLVSLFWPPTEPGGYSLIVDADAVIDGNVVRLTPTKAVLHRPADHAAGGVAGSSAGACGSDCAPVSIA